MIKNVMLVLRINHAKIKKSNNKRNLSFFLTHIPQIKRRNFSHTNARDKRAARGGLTGSTSDDDDDDDDDKSVRGSTFSRAAHMSAAFWRSHTSSDTAKNDSHIRTSSRL